MTDAVADALRPVASRPAPAIRVRGYWGNVWQRLRYDYVTLFCMAVIVIIVLLAVFAPLVAPMDPYKSSMAHRLRPILSAGHILGTDEQGRDMLSRMIYGGRVSLTMGILPVVLATFIGGSFGVVAGYLSGKVNMVIMRSMDVFFAFPSVLLAVAISGSLGGGIGNQLITLTIILIPPLCRVAETATAQVRGMDFVDAAPLDRRFDRLHSVHPRAHQRDVARAGLRLDACLGLHHSRLRPLVPGPRRLAADPRLGAHAVDLARVDLRAAAGQRHSRDRHPHHLDRLQSGQRRLAAGDGRQGLRGGRADDLFHRLPAPPRCARGTRPRRPRPAAADRRGPAQVFPHPGRPCSIAGSPK